MNQLEAKAMLEKVAQGSLSVGEALLAMKEAPFTDMEFAKVDHHRELRQGVAEVIYGAGKTLEQMNRIVSMMREKGQETILITRIEKEDAMALSKIFPASYNELGRTLMIGKCPENSGRGKVAVVTGGTSDIPVAEEAAVTLEALGNEVNRVYDVGVAGIHRLFANMDEIMEASAVVAIAGMEGALASVVGGLVDCPVIAVPTSVGYGASFGGISALLSMLNSCASGVSVVNIDNGFGAGYIASMINHIGGEK